MASKAKKTASKLKLTQKKKVNKWLIAGGIAAIAIIGVVVVRYSGASGKIWSIRSAEVSHTGGAVKTKDNGTAYWIGTKKGEGVIFTAPTAGRYCLEGKYLTKDMTVSLGSGDGQGHGMGGTGSIGNETNYKYCQNLSKGYKLYVGIQSSGTLVFNRVRQQ